jgi:D-glycero-D-manno-heptose 1,7-bisphosphate phosphatase
MYKLIIFDLDGTLVVPKSGAMFRKTADDWQLIPGRQAKLSSLRAQGVRLALATNQGGVAFGYFTQEDILREITKAAKTLHIPLGGLYICYTHPNASVAEYRYEDARRKPGPIMLEQAMHDFEADVEETLMVGDRSEDQEAAERAGCNFMWAEDFFKEDVK